MLKYCLKRLALAVLTMLIIIAITFFTMNAIPGGPFDSEKAPSPEIMAVLNQRYNLDKPLGQQFLIYLKNLLHGDLGISIKTGRDISKTISESFRVSAVIGLESVVVALFFGLLFGCIAAYFVNRWPDRIIMFFSSLLVSVPSFIIASILMLVFCLKLKLIPAWTPGSFSILPVLALAIFPMSNITRFTKTSMLDIMNQNYIRTARAGGIPEWKIIIKHAFRNASIPVITYVGPMVAGVLSGSFVIETVFTVGGLGSQFVTAITNRDYTLIMGITVFLAAIIIGISLLSDILYKLVDPRINF